jgi:hypothetical protein
MSAAAGGAGKPRANVGGRPSNATRAKTAAAKDSKQMQLIWEPTINVSAEAGASASFVINSALMPTHAAVGAAGGGASAAGVPVGASSGASAAAAAAGHRATGSKRKAPGDPDDDDSSDSDSDGSISAAAAAPAPAAKKGKAAVKLPPTTRHASRRSCGARRTAALARLSSSSSAQ